MEKLKFLVILGLFVSCGQNDELSTPYTGEVSYSLNGVEQYSEDVSFRFDDSNAAKKCGLRSYVFSVYNYNNKINNLDNGAQSFEAVFFNKLSGEQGRRVLSPTQPCDSSSAAGVSLFGLLADDLIAGTYALFGEGEENWIEITELDTIRQQVTGKFNLNFAVVQEHEKNTLPDTIRITQGNFKVKILSENI